MAERRPIAEFFKIDYPPDVIVGDDAGKQAPAAIDPDTGCWVDLTPGDVLSEPDLLKFEPTWFRVIVQLS